jgi:hypothetical protein
MNFKKVKGQFIYKLTLFNFSIIGSYYFNELGVAEKVLQTSFSTS